MPLPRRSAACPSNRRHAAARDTPAPRHGALRRLLGRLLLGLLPTLPACAEAPDATTATAAAGQPDAAASAGWQAVVLLYHHVGKDTPPATSVTPAQFRDHLAWLDAMGLTVVPLADVIAAVRGTGSLPPNAVAITFDDGYTSVHANALPILRAAGLPFTVFVNSDAHGPLPGAYMSWDQLREVEAAGGSIANHTASHPHLPLFSGDLGAELLGAQARLEAELAAPLRAHAYPYGEATAAARAALAAAGFVAFGQQSGAIGPLSDPLNLPRFPMASAFADLEGFSTKVATLPLPVADQAQFPDGVLQQGDPPPVLDLHLTHPVQGTLQCFASRQGAAEVTRIAPQHYRVQAREPLPPGRSRYNCTAASDAPPLPAPPGLETEVVQRFHWLSHQWLVLEGWVPD